MWLALGIIVLIATIAGAELIFLSKLRESALQTAESTLARYSLMLSEQTDRSLKSLDLVLSSVGDYVGRKGVTDSASYNNSMVDYDTFLFLKEKITGLPQLDAVTVINSNGKLLNFSRYWPIPEVNVADRDYFQALKADPDLESFTSKPVRNRGSGTWNIYIARRLNDPNGGFLGLLLGAVSLQNLENTFGSLGLDDGAISLVRDDGILLARFPHTEAVGSIATRAAEHALGAGGIIREVNAGDQKMWIMSARMLANFPLAILVEQSEESALQQWRRMAGGLVVTSLAFYLVILIAAFAIARWWSEQNRATRAAQAASRAKSSFLAVMSHEIRTPMNAVLGLASTLLESNLEDEHRKTVQAIHDAGDHLLVILNDILDYSKLEAGKLSFEHMTFSPVTIVENALSIIRPRATAKGLSIRTLADPVLPDALSGDAGRIRQVLLNLVSNAVKFTQTGEIVVSVRHVGRINGRATVEWVVTDTGIGIAPERIGALFGDFVQADSTINRRFGGSGLGLAISKRIVEQMGGDIAVASTLGQGTTIRFSLSLPTAVAAVQPADRQEDPNAALHARIARVGRPLRVLIADDNATNRLVAAKMLQEFNVQTAMACDGAEAIAAVSQFTYDLILMDMRMPEMDGLEAARAIRSRGDATGSIPIIAFTANAFEDDVKACRDAGMNDFVAKPVRKKVLVDAILRVWPGDKALLGGTPAAETQRAVSGRTLPALSTPAFDRTVFDELAKEIGAAAMSESLAVFIEETETRLAAFRSLSCDADQETIAREAHSLKSTAGTFGLRQLAELAGALERNASRTTALEYGATIDDLDAAFERGRALLPAPFSRAA